MTDDPAFSGDDAQEDLMAKVDTSVPVSARIWNYWMGVMYEGVDTDPAQDEALRQYNESGAVPYRVRRPEQVVRFFDGLQLADPGVVPIHQWRPDPGTLNATAVPALGGVGKKP